MADRLTGMLQSHVECCVCIGVMHNAASCTPCQHTFCAGCIYRWITSGNNGCPVCRHLINDIHPNRNARDLVETFLRLKPNERKSENDRKAMDRVELEFLIRQLGRSDRRLMRIESMVLAGRFSNRFDDKYERMLERASQLVKTTVEKTNPDVSISAISDQINTLVVKLARDQLPETIGETYLNFELAYRNLLRISMPLIGPQGHTRLGNQMFEANNEVLDYSPKPVYPVANQSISSKISTLIASFQTPINVRTSPTPQAPKSNRTEPQVVRRSARLAARNLNL